MVSLRFCCISILIKQSALLILLPALAWAQRSGSEDLDARLRSTPICSRAAAAEGQQQPRIRSSSRGAAAAAEQQQESVAQENQNEE